MIYKGNKPILFFYVSCKPQICGIALVIIINVNTYKRLFLYTYISTLSREPKLRKAGLTGNDNPCLML
jgi:hypothetical protein